MDGSSSACAPLPSFGAVTKYGAANSIALAIGDVDRDGIKDAVVVTRTMTTGEVTIFKGIGGGAFGASRQLYSGTSTQATGVLIGDVDADGSNDIVTWDGASPVGGTKTDLVSVHRQNIATAGTFLAAQTFSVPNVRGVVASKLDADTRMDLVIQSRSPDEIYPYFASTSSAGVYTKGTVIAAPNMLDGTLASHVLDIDGDTFDDVVFTRMTGGLALAFNNHTVAAGTFAGAAVGAGSAYNASFGHYTGQGVRLDVIQYSHDSPQSGTLYAQTAPRVFEMRVVSGLDIVSTTSVNTPGFGMKVVDINADGRDDIVGLNSAVLQCPTLPLSFYPGMGVAERIMFGGLTTNSELGMFVDLDGNGKPDYVNLTGATGSQGGTFLETFLQ